MCMGPSKLIRFGSFCISTPEFYIPVIVIIIIIVIIVITTIY
jgi:hypothetical protein